MWLSAFGYKWLEPLPPSALHVVVLPGLEGWGRMAEVWGGAVLKGGEIGWDGGGEDLSVDHHLGPGGLW